MICYAYDYEEYADKRGLYFDIRDSLPGGSISEGELLHLVKNLPYQESLELVREFREKYIESYGNATTASVDKIFENIALVEETSIQPVE